MTMRHILFGLTLALSACNPNQAPLEEPAATVPDTVTAQQVETAVRAGLDTKGWAVVSEEPGAIVAEVSAGGHSAKVRVTFDASGWAVSYMEVSPGLQYEEHPEHGPIVHHRYNLWVRNLNAAIQSALDSGAPAPAASGEAAAEAPAEGADTDGAAATGGRDPAAGEDDADTHADEWD